MHFVECPIANSRNSAPRLQATCHKIDIRMGSGEDLQVYTVFLSGEREASFPANITTCKKLSAKKSPTNLYPLLDILNITGQKPALI